MYVFALWRHVLLPVQLLNTEQMHNGNQARTLLSAVLLRTLYGACSLLQYWRAA
jgi:hypothetical protein